jgi:hypothetical protein
MLLAVRTPRAQLRLRFRRNLQPMAFLSNGTAKRISIAFMAQSCLNVPCAATRVNSVGTRLRFSGRMNGAWRTNESKA